MGHTVGAGYGRVERLHASGAVGAVSDWALEAGEVSSAAGPGAIDSACIVPQYVRQTQRRVLAVRAAQLGTGPR